MTTILGLVNYVGALVMVLFGIYSMMVRRHLIQKVIGMAVLQTGTILFFISLAVKSNAAAPIIDPHKLGHHALSVEHYANPLPHALMLTAIVVSVATLGVALTLAVSLYRKFGSLEEDEIIQQLDKSS